MTLPDLVRLNYKLTEESKYLKINNMRVRKEMIAQTETYRGKRQSLRKKLWRGLAKNCSRRLAWKLQFL